MERFINTLINNGKRGQSPFVLWANGVRVIDPYKCPLLADMSQSLKNLIGWSPAIIAIEFQRPNRRNVPIAVIKSLDRIQCKVESGI